jgi:hypothetical protein
MLQKNIQYLIVFLGIFFYFGAINSVFAIPISNTIIPSKNYLSQTQNVVVTANVELSSQQKYLVQKNSIISLNNPKNVNEASKLVINVYGYQNQPQKNTDILISIFDSKKNMLAQIPSFTNNNGATQIYLSRYLTLLPSLSIGFNLQKDDIYDPTQKEFKLVSYVFKKPHFNTQKNIINLITIPSYNGHKNRVLFVFSTRLKNDTLTRGNYAYYKKQNTSSQIHYITWSARDGHFYYFV